MFDIVFCVISLLTFWTLGNTTNPKQNRKDIWKKSERERERGRGWWKCRG